MIIEAYKDGRFFGYIKSVSQAKGVFKTVTDIRSAKHYGSIDSVMHEIDNLTKIGYTQGYIFTYK